MAVLNRYLITLALPKGQTAELEVPSLDEGFAGRRAVITACALGWGDLDTVAVTASRVLAPEEWSP